MDKCPYAAARLAAGLIAFALSATGCELFQPRCEDYCARIVECELDGQDSCMNSCFMSSFTATKLWGESCIDTGSCGDISRCILCDQYCSQLDTCGVETDTDCTESCDTLLAAGADENNYQCVVDSACDDVPNCGI